jgi:KipI family sensor histidine kinase inhibitor
MDEAAPTRPVIRHASDHSLLVSFGQEISQEAHAQVRRLLHLLQAEPPAGVLNLHPAYASLLVSYDPLRADREELQREIEHRLTGAGEAALPEPCLVEVPVCYGGEFGPDLGEVAAACGFHPAEVIREHAAGDYLVYFLGFAPGFPYLGGMSPRIAAPRRATPRKRVPAGSVAIGGNQTGIYPTASPGGWQLIGRTPLALFDPGRTPPALLALGDRVRFVAMGEDEFRRAASQGEGGVPEVRPDGAQIRVMEPGFQTTVQDLGRPGHAHIGVSASGACDPLSLRVANWLVGNGEGAPALEMTLAGGTFAFAGPGLIALAGSDFEPVIDGYRVPPWGAIEVRQGQTLVCGATRSGARCYVSARGGIALGAVLGSRSTHLTTGLGGLAGRALRKDDTLAVGTAAEQAPTTRRFPREGAGKLLRRGELRVTRGPQWEWFGEKAWEAFLESTYTVSEDSSRMGLRLRGAALPAERQGSMVTEGVSLGALQVPPDGQPILSFVEHQTTGGYPQIACVIAADLHRIGQLRPRDEVRFKEVPLAEADEALREQEALLRTHLDRSE